MKDPFIPKTTHSDITFRLADKDEEIYQILYQGKHLGFLTTTEDKKFGISSGNRVGDRMKIKMFPSIDLGILMLKCQKSHLFGPSYKEISTTLDSVQLTRSRHFLRKGYSVLYQGHRIGYVFVNSKITYFCTPVNQFWPVHITNSPPKQNEVDRGIELLIATHRYKLILDME